MQRPWPLKRGAAERERPGLIRAALVAVLAGAFLLSNSSIVYPEGESVATGSVAAPKALAETLSDPGDGGLLDASALQAVEPASPFVFSGDPAARANAIECLASAGVYEAGDDADGQRAVAQVVLNRARHPAFPNSICAVVFQGSQRTTGCQFTFTCDGSLARSISSAAWNRAREVASEALDGYVDERVGSATHYHADYVNPYWAARLQRQAVVGRHRFFRFPGDAGAARMLSRPVVADEKRYEDLVAAAQERSTRAVAEQVSPTEPGLALPTGALPSIAYAPSILPPPIPPGTHFGSVNAQSPAGRWAVLGLDACQQQQDCVYLAYSNPAEANSAKLTDEARRPVPLFVLVKDGASGTQLPFWDCTRVQAPRPDQCLPSDTGQQSRLLRNRG